MCIFEGRICSTGANGTGGQVVSKEKKRDDSANLQHPAVLVCEKGRGCREREYLWKGQAYIAFLHWGDEGEGDS